ncbi:Methyltransferase domain-containing protein [Natronincola peptidivorans]|uniref:Methyltransferase domain-containing protein n=1 Tax=Natronincola peptidivorans TaxID=426128 RepID=A0A1I0B067_9FIRM|nr:class I SAM-dependent methyltransferase [Natronincola peptidivorans]SES99447.1 Methyltransferase domain-containing protein [Natronincola peptidivorans]
MEKYFFEAFDGLTRLGPGSKESTLKAIAMFDKAEEPIRILDVGCGNGIHTLLLAGALPNASIVAIDNHAPYIESLNQSAKRYGFSDRVIGKCLSMFEMDFEEDSFHLIWSEGAIYIAGFEKALRDWKRFLKKDGYLICSEVIWLTDHPSKEAYDFWQKEYPEIDTLENKIQQIKAAGYHYQSHFTTPVTDWTEHYFSPLQNNLHIMREKYKDNEVAKEVIDTLQAEIDLYYKCFSEYGYVFFAMSK